MILDTLMVLKLTLLRENFLPFNLSCGKHVPPRRNIKFFVTVHSFIYLRTERGLTKIFSSNLNRLGTRIPIIFLSFWIKLLEYLTTVCENRLEITWILPDNLRRCLYRFRFEVDIHFLKFQLTLLFV